MRIHLVKKTTIEQYVLDNAQSKTVMQNWLKAIRGADWNDPNDIKNTFSSLDFLGRGTQRVVLDIGGNNYRMICYYTFGKKFAHLFICWIGTHAEYTKLCAANKQYTISEY